MGLFRKSAPSAPSGPAPTASNQVADSRVREPATVETCQSDYAAGQQARASLTADAKKRFGTST
jgi:hypothetical protein